jgi:hypothetical protein
MRPMYEFASSSNLELMLLVACGTLLQVANASLFGRSRLLDTSVLTKWLISKIRNSLGQGDTALPVHAESHSSESVANPAESLSAHESNVGLGKLRCTLKAAILAQLCHECKCLCLHRSLACFKFKS